MSLAPGARLGPYEILSAIGAGGMGEVYKARDTKLNRDVALKILPDAFALDPDRLARFKREAQVLASLNHPNIAAIYGFEDSGSTHALVLELVEGPTLADRIARGPIPLDEALPIAKQIAEALEAAHEQGIIHRDLKPANIKVRENGTVKVLDFGLAKAIAQVSDLSCGPADGPTITTSDRMTATGVILGTATYMAPEQATGDRVNKRTDLWSFGAVLYEMLTGRLAFSGDSTSQVLAAVLDREPDWRRLPAETPPAIRKLLRRCLAKDWRHRIADAADMRLEIEDGLRPSPLVVAPTDSRRTHWVVSTIAIAALVAVSATPRTSALFVALLSRLAPASSSFAPVYASVDAPQGFVLGEDDGLVSLPTRTPVVFTADGRAIIMEAARDGKPQLFIRALDRPDARPIAGTENARVPFVSPDGKWIGFSNGVELRKVPTDGGAPTTICPLIASLGPLGASWGSRDVIVFGDGTSGRIMRVSAGGGAPTPVTAVPGTRRLYVTPFFLPDGERFLFADVSVLDASDARLMVQSVNGGPAQPVLTSATDGRLLPSGQLVFMRLGTLMSVGFDAARGRTTGNPVAVMSGVMQSGLRGRAGANNTGAGMFAVSTEGHLAAIRGAVIGGEATPLIWVTRDGQRSSAEPTTGATPSSNRLYSRVSSDQSRAIVSVITPLRFERWIADWTRNIWTPCGTCGTDPMLPAIWAPDGRRVLFGENESLVAHTLDESAPDQMLLHEPNRTLSAASWLGDGRILYESRVATFGNGSVDADIKLLAPGAREGSLIARGSAPSASPDGRWLAYGATESGQTNVIMQPLQEGGARVPLSAGDGFDPVWSADGRTVFYLRQNTNPNAVGAWATDIAIKAGKVSVGISRELFQVAGSQTCTPRCHDVVSGPAGFRFLLRDRSVVKRESVTRMDLVLNWTSTLPKD